MTDQITVNGRRFKVTFAGDDTLLDVLRAVGCTEVKRGCEHGECGSCLVLVDGKPINACQVYAATVGDAEIVTSRGLTPDGSPHPIHDAFAESGAVQCGFCTPGIVIATYALLHERNNPTDSEIREALGGNICRCTGYVKVVEAVRNACERTRR